MIYIYIYISYIYIICQARKTGLSTIEMQMIIPQLANGESMSKFVIHSFI